MDYYAHSKENEKPENWQPLTVHLGNVAEMTAEFSAKFDAEE